MATDSNSLQRDIWWTWSFGMGVSYFVTFLGQLFYTSVATINATGERVPSSMGICCMLRRFVTGGGVLFPSKGDGLVASMITWTAGCPPPASPA